MFKAKMNGLTSFRISRHSAVLKRCWLFKAVALNEYKEDGGDSDSAVDEEFEEEEADEESAAE
jgi:hypothetical protein